MNLRVRPLQNLRAVSINVDGVLLVNAGGGGPRVPHGVGGVLDLLRFFDLRLVAVRHEDLGKSAVPPPAFPENLAGYFEANLVLPAVARARAKTPDYRPVADALQLAPVDILHVGADLENDINAALAAGMRAAWLPGGGRAFQPAGAAVLLGAFSDLPELLRQADTARFQRNPADARHTRNLVALLRGVPGEREPAGRRHEAPERLAGELMLEGMAQLGAKAGPLELLRENWGQIIGAKFAAASEAESLSQSGTLSIYCENGIVRNELLFDRRKILAAVQQFCPGVRDVFFRATR
jgi:hypothetical protein